MVYKVLQTQGGWTAAAYLVELEDKCYFLEVYVL